MSPQRRAAIVGAVSVALQGPGMVEMAVADAGDGGIPYDPRLALVAPEDFNRTMSDQEYFDSVMSFNAFQRYIALEGATEKPYSGKTINGFSWNNTLEGIYVSAISGATLFSSKTKFDGGIGWPTFYAPVNAADIVTRIDPNDQRTKEPNKWRTEVLDRASMTHLGHVFNDPSQPTGKRYRINTVVLRFLPSSTTVIGGSKY